MKKKAVIFSVLIFALLVVTFLSIQPIQRGFWTAELLSEREIEGAAVREERSSSILGGLTRYERTYDLSNGDCVVFGRMEAGEDVSSWHMVRSDILECESATIWYYDTDTAYWKTVPLGEMEIGSTCIIIDSDTQDYFYYPPIGYERLENNSLDENASKGYLTVKKAGGKWKLHLFGSALQPKEICDYTVVKTSGEAQILDTSSEPMMKLWSTYCHNGDGRWCYDGYYFPAAATYIPTGDGCLYRCVAAYFAKSMVGLSRSTRCAQDMSVAILDTIALQQNEEGYFPTMSGSTWLMEDYGIPAGFYDTRFNSDLMLVYYSHMLRAGGFEQTVSRYFDFFLKYAQDHHYETQRGGYLVWDYNNSTSPVHSSLNHQLAEMLILYRFSELLERPDLEQLADRMLTAIEDTCSEWITDNGDLYYGYYAEKGCANQDYLYLTYNDLYYLQNVLEEMGKGRNEALDTLMESKLAWLQANGVTGYEGS